MKYYITTAIDYVNAKPHIGHAYEKICSDVLARWHSIKGEDVFFLTGTDENAQKNVKSAKEAGIPIKTFVDKNSKLFIDLCKKLNISQNYFIRTTEARHTKLAKEIFKKIYDKGEIYKGKYKGLYCEGCEAFITKRELVDDKCPEHKTKPKLISEESYFFKLSKYHNKILKLIESGKFVLPEKRKNEVLSRLKSEKLGDLCVSRLNTDWGIKTPIDDKHTIYVWIDALSNYITALDYPNGAKFKKYWPADVHVVGKGINWFHSIIWPALLLSLDLELPKKIFVHGYVNVKGEKISKSLGNVIDPVKLVDEYGADALRYFLVREIPFGEDGDFSEESLKTRLNNELANDLGNLLNRTLTLVSKNKVKLEGKQELKVDIKKIDDLVCNFDIHAALNEIWKFINDVNRYLNEKEPWKLKGKELSNVIYNCVESLRIISILLSPFIPETCDKINKQLGVKLGKLKDCKFSKFKGKIKKGEVLFKKI